MILGVAGLRPNFFSSGRIFLAELAQESWRDLAAVNSWELSYSWKVWYRHNGGAVLLVNVFLKLSSPAPTPWQSPDCIPIVGSAKSLVPNDKRFNHTKVWCTFIFIDLQASKSKLKVNKFQQIYGKM